MNTIETESLTVILPQPLVQRLDALCEVLKKGQADLVKYALQDWLAKMEQQDRIQKRLLDVFFEEKISYDTLKRSLEESERSDPPGSMDKDATQEHNGS